jgi:hypothetical protein
MSGDHSFQRRNRMRGRRSSTQAEYVVFDAPRTGEKHVADVPSMVDAEAKGCCRRRTMWRCQALDDKGLAALSSYLSNGSEQCQVTKVLHSIIADSVTVVSRFVAQ